MFLVYPTNLNWVNSNIKQAEIGMRQCLAASFEKCQADIKLIHDEKDEKVNKN